MTSRAPGVWAVSILAVIGIGCAPARGRGGGPRAGNTGSGSTAAIEATGGSAGRSATFPGSGGSLPPGECVPACQTGFDCQNGDCVIIGAGQCAPACGAGLDCQDGVCIVEGIKGTPPQTGGASWTILVYMAADNNLEEAAMSDLLEMETVGGTSSFRFVIQIDRSTFYSGRDPELGIFEGVKRVVIDQNGVSEVADLGELNTATGSAVADFVAWGTANYPADRVGLILWDHGGGINGFGTDDTASAGPISLLELRNGIAAGLQTSGLPRLNLLGFDACLMATAEVAFVFSPFAEFMVASEELEPGHGWDYRSFVAIRDDPGLPVPNLGTAIINGFVEQAQAAGTDPGITLSLLDLTQVPVLHAALDVLASGLEGDYQQDTTVGQRVALARQQSLDLIVAFLAHVSNVLRGTARPSHRFAGHHPVCAL